MIYYFDESPFHHTEKGCARLQRTTQEILESETPRKGSSLCSLCRRRKTHPLAIAKTFTALEKYRRKGVVIPREHGCFQIFVEGLPMLEINSDGSFWIKGAV